MSRISAFVRVFGAALIVALSAAAVPLQNSSDLFVIDHVNIIDGRGGVMIRNGVIAIQNGRILQIGERGDVRVPSRSVYDANGKWAVPGLIDAHVHFDQSADLYTRPDVIDLRKRKPYDDEIRWTRQRIPLTLERYLASGVTGVMDMGGPLWLFEVRELAKRQPAAPQVGVAGWLISTHPAPELDSADPPLMVADSPERARELVRTELERKPDLIKVLFDHRFGDDLELQSEIVRAVIEQSHAGGVRVAVHAIELETAKAALKAGADILVHSVEDKPVDPEFVNLARRGNILYIPTLAVLEGYSEVFSGKVALTDIEKRLGDPQVIQTWSDLLRIPPAEMPPLPVIPVPPKRPVYYDNLALLDSVGVRVAAGSDAGNIGTLHGPAIHREMELMAEAGMRPIDILGAATRNGAAVMGRDKEAGTLEKGKVADLLILDADPTRDVKNLRRIAKIMKGGAFVTVDEAKLK